MIVSLSMDIIKGFLSLFPLKRLSFDLSIPGLFLSLSESDLQWTDGCDW